jgi:hypothetical protein
LFLMLAASAVVACGGNGGSTAPDAKVFMDAPAPPDAPPSGLTGLGQKCGAGLPACPANASECFGLAGTNGNTYCSPKCVAGGTATGAANNQLSNIQPAPNTTCTTAYSGTVGMGACGVILKFTPMDNPIVVGKAYTGVDLGCVVRCGAGNTCPPTHSTATIGTSCICVPQ